MIGLVLVTHSARLAEGILELVNQMVQGGTPLAAAGGTDLPEAPIGTDPTKVVAAIEQLLSQDEVSEVLVLMDLGSALMSAETALDFLPDDQRQRVHLASAPLVEGALAAAVRARIGGSLAQVLAEANGALAAKHEQLASWQHSLPPLSAETPTTDPTAYAELTIIVPNRLGLHARPAARLVSLAAQYDAQVTLTHNGRTVPATSLNQVVTLGVRQEDLLVVRATGTDAPAALAALEDLALDNFGDPIEVTEPLEIIAAAAVIAGGDSFAGVPASAGTASGPAYRLRLPALDLEEQPTDDPAAERQKLRSAVDAVIEQLRALRSELGQRAGAAEAGIFDAQILMIHDNDLIQSAEETIELRRIDAASAWNWALRSMVARYRALEDDYLARRADDVADAGQRVLRLLAGLPAESPLFAPPEPAILVTTELKPSDVARLPADQVLGIVTAEGGATGHSAILARSLGIPTVTGIGAAAVASIREGQTIALDGDNGLVWPAPDPTLCDRLLARRTAWLAQRQKAQQQALAPAITLDRQTIQVAANINLPGDLAMALANGAEGVGLFRTEFLYMDRESPPSEEEQLAAYLEAARRLQGRPLIVRTLDVGGDKPLPYLRYPHEQNPFLGHRGLRYCLDHPGLFRPQLRAILRAAAQFPVRVMFPMVSTWDELVLVDALIDEICAELQTEQHPFDEDIQRGIMVETPAAVLLAPQLARLVDFFSIGTNDLTQYVMAADRGNAAVAGLVNAYQPAVLHAIRQTTQAGHAQGIPVGICGELAGDPRATALLVGLGLDELSMTAAAIPAVKAQIRQLHTADAARIAETALQFSTVEEIQVYLKQTAPAPEKE
ncbi:MAG: phosphoenolpyruvate--protein phosphotransferase [Caldilinea sp.]